MREIVGRLAKPVGGHLLRSVYASVWSVVRFAGELLLADVGVKAIFGVDVAVGGDGVAVGVGDEESEAVGETMLECVLFDALLFLLFLLVLLLLVLWLVLDVDDAGDGTSAMVVAKI